MRTSVPAFVSLLLARIVAVIGFSVLVAWVAHFPKIIQIHSSLAPMQFNTALSLFLSALGLILLQREKRQWAVIPAVLTFSIGLLTFLQYMLNVDLGIDQLLIHSYMPAVHTHPGRMGSNSALCFILIGAAEVSIAFQSNRKSGQLPIFMGISVTAFACLAIFGFITKLPVHFGWGNFSTMAVHTAISFLLMGIAVVLTAGRIGSIEKRTFKDFIPMLVAITVLTGTIALWQTALWNEAREIKHTTEQEGVAIRSQLLQGLEDRIQSIERMAGRLEFKTAPSKEAWESDADMYIKHLGVIEAFAVIDTNYIVKWIHPTQGNQAYVHLNLSKETVRREAIDLAKTSKTTQLTPVVNLKQGGRGFVLYVPLFQRETYLGTLAASVRPAKFLQRILQTPGYQIKVHSGDELLYSNEQEGQTSTDHLWSVTTPIDLRGHLWNVEVIPTAATIRSGESVIPYVILFTGVMASLLLGVLAQLSLTARRQSRVIGEQKSFVDGVIDSSPLAILVIGKNHRVQMWNPACERIFGWSSEEAMGKPLPFVPDESRVASDALIERIITSGERVETETIRRTKDGRYIPVSIAARALYDEHGETYGLMALMDDVTIRQQNEREIREAHELAEKAAMVKAQFLANMSHEIRTPLNGIIGMADLLLLSKLNEDQKRFTKIIQNSGTSLLALINDILDFSKLEAGKMQLEMLDFSVVALVETQTDLLIAKARKKGLVVSTYISPHLPAVVRGDSGRLAQVILNLLGNAIKFTESGSIQISAVEVNPSPVEAGPLRIRFEVTDTGMGLSKESAQLLFLPFSQVDGSMARKFGGTGLGLSISKNIVEAMGGKIGIESTEGVGSTFWFEVELNHTRDAKPMSVNRKVLVVDEDEVSSQTILRYLTAWRMPGKSVSSVKDGISVLEKAIQEGQAYDIVLLGNKFAEQQVAFSAGGARVILLCEFEDPSSDSVYITKPVKQSDLYDSLAEFCLLETNADPKNAPVPIASVRKDVQDAYVLVADDVAANQLLTVKFLEFLGYRAIAVANGKEVLERIEQEHFDLILMDCQMPEMDGFEATRRIRALEDGKLNGIPIIALTANAMAGDDLKCLEAGMDDYLSKPFKKERLGDILAKWLPKQSAKKSS